MKNSKGNKGTGPSKIYREADNEMGPLFFRGSEEAVETISGLLKKEDWKGLSRYYDLSGSGVDLEELESGRFFVRAERPEVSHPAGFWRYKHPFAPGFSYKSHSQKGEDKIIVTVGIEIDQGGGMMQRGFSRFMMRISPQGYRILPGEMK